MNKKSIFLCLTIVLVFSSMLAENLLVSDDASTMTEVSDMDQNNVYVPSLVTWDSTDDNADAYDDSGGNYYVSLGNHANDDDSDYRCVGRTVLSIPYTIIQYWNFTIPKIVYDSVGAPQLDVHADLLSSQYAERFVEIYNFTSGTWTILASDNNEADFWWNVNEAFDIDMVDNFEYDDTYMEYTIATRLRIFKDAGVVGSYIYAYFMANLFGDFDTVMEVKNALFYVQDDYITLAFSTNYDDYSLTVFDNGSIVGYAQDGSSWYQIVKPTTSGLHVFDILLNGSHSGASYDGQTWDTSLTDNSWVWYQALVTINPVTFEIKDLIVMQNNDTVLVSGWFFVPVTTLTWTLYEDGSLTDSGTIVLSASGSYYTIMWTKTSPTVLGNFTLTITSGSSSIVIHGYSIVINSVTYYQTWNSSVLEQGNTYYQSSVDEVSFWSTMGLIIVSIFIPFAIGIGYVMRLLRDRRKKSKPKDTVSSLYRG